MNRREFTLSLGALTALPALPLSASPMASAASGAASVPPGSYAWAQLIARAQNKCSPALLARQLRLPLDTAQVLFDEMVRDGVLRAPGAAGIAQAAKPINATGSTPTGLRQRLSRVRELVQSDTAPPLAKPDDPCLGCDTAAPEDHQHASTTEPLQESPQKG